MCVCVFVCTYVYKYMHLNVLPVLQLRFSFLHGITKYSLGQKPGMNLKMFLSSVNERLKQF